MLSKTHLTIGIATALAVCMPSSAGALAAAVAGGAAGAVLCDIECKGRRDRDLKDASVGRLIALGIGLIVLSADFLSKSGLVADMIARIRMHEFSDPAKGALILLVTCIIGRCSAHRTFTHSILYVGLLCVGFYLIEPALLVPTACGGLSHLILDTLNKKPVPWLYPFFRPGICLRLFYSDRTANSFFGLAGLISTAALLSWRIVVIGKAFAR